MNEKSTPTDEQSSGPLCGERLSEARRKNDISVRDIAKELHLDEPTVLALEKNQFAALGAPVFAKGHLRKYAELVDVSIDDVMADYYQMNRSTTAPPVVGPKRTQTTEIAFGRWLGGILVVLLLAAITYWWVTAGQDWFARVEPQETTPLARPVDDTADLAPELPAPAPTVTPSQLATADAVEVPTGATQSGTGDGTDPATDAVDIAAQEGGQTVVATSRNAAAAPLAGPGEVALQLSFNNDCWTEISDATGRRLFYDLGAAGRVVTVAGTAPLRVVLGDSTDVSIRVNGEEYPIPASARSGRLARLTIDP